jgi:hypothetical protein
MELTRSFMFFGFFVLSLGSAGLGRTTPTFRALPVALDSFSRDKPRYQMEQVSLFLFLKQARLA